MFKKFTFSNQLSKEEEIKIALSDISRTCRKVKNKDFVKLDLCDYRYDVEEAVAELGLEKELIYQLLDSYVIQILEAITEFNSYIDELEANSNRGLALEYKKLRELAHKNLGVARNLHIKDAQKLLTILMKEDDLEYLRLCLYTLEAVSIKLRPNCAYNALNLIKIKKSF